MTIASLGQPIVVTNQGQLLFSEQWHCKPQKPPQSVSFAGQTIVVTGSNVGIGLETTKCMLDSGATHIIMAVRTIAKGEQAATPLRQAHPKAKIEVWPLNMCSYESVQAFAKQCSDLPRLDIAILNAAASASATFLRESSGHEQSLQVNVLSTALLGILLLPILKKASKPERPSRLSIVSSGLALTTPLKLRDADPLFPAMDDEKGWGLMAASERYSDTKLLETMIVLKMGEVVNSDDVVVNAVDPGFTRGTQLQRNAPWYVKLILRGLQMVVSRSVEHAAWTYVDAVAVKDKLSHGCLLIGWKIFHFHKMMYTPEGQRTTERVWAETLKELEFANVQGILDGMRKDA